jgi:hypothetical protein
VNRFLRYSLQNGRKIRLMLLLDGAIIQKNAVVLALYETSAILRFSSKKEPVTVALTDVLSCDYARGDHGEE